VKPTTVPNINASAKRAKINKKKGGHSYSLPKDSLSSRETEVSKLLVKGMQLREVALQLKISIHTADSHARRAYEKLGLHDRCELVKYFAEPNVIAVRDTLTNSTPMCGPNPDPLAPNAFPRTRISLEN
jgi:DNA-binding NarL/FixJ family response regulator